VKTLAGGVPDDVLPRSASAAAGPRSIRRQLCVLGLSARRDMQGWGCGEAG